MKLSPYYKVKYIFSFILSLILLLALSTVFITQTQDKPLDQHIQENKQQTSGQLTKLEEISEKLIFAAWPEYSDPTFDSNKVSLYPTKSINEQAVDIFYGKLGLDVNSKNKRLLDYIKIFYFYFEYCTRREKAAKILKLAQQQRLEYKDLIEKSGWSGLIKAVAARTSTKYESIILDLKDQDIWNNLNQAILITILRESPNKSTQNYWQTLINSSFWKEIPVSKTDLQNSLFWQNYIKSMITSRFKLDQSLLNSKLASAQQFFTYLPFLETAYYVPDCIEQRYKTEITQLSLLLNDHIKDNLVAQCTDWKNLITKNSKDYDYNALLNEASLFEKSEIYQTIQNLSNPGSGGANSPYVVGPDKKITLRPVQLPEPLKHEIIFFSMANALQTFLEPFFIDEELLDHTLQVLASTQAPQPSLNYYSINDASYLQDFAALSSQIRILAQKTAQITQANYSKPTQASGVPNLSPRTIGTKLAMSRAGLAYDNELVIPQGFLDVVSDFGSRIGNEIANIGESAWSTAKDVAYIVKDEGKVVYYYSGLATIIQQMPYSQAMEAAQASQDAANHDFKSFSNDVSKLVSNAAKLSLDINTGPLALALGAIGTIVNNPALSENYHNMIDSVADGLGTAIAAGAQASLSLTASGFRLSAQAIALIANTVIIVGSGGQIGTNVWTDQVKMLAYDIVTSYLEPAIIAMNAASQVISDLIKASAYLVKLLTDSIVEILPIIAASATFFIPFDDPSHVYDKVHGSLEEHKLIISQIVTTGLLIGAGVATGGGIGLAIANLAFGGFMVASAAQQEAQVSDMRNEIQDYLNRFKNWTKNQTFIGKAMQQAVSREIGSQLDSEIANKKLGLGFYKNFLQETVSRLICQQSQSLGAYQAQLLATDKTTQIAFADAGSLYGFNTGWLNLNPSQGLVAYEPSRQHFAQEIAQAPATFNATDPKTGQPIEISRFWFLQSLTKDFSLESLGITKPSDTINFHIRLRPIYMLDKFYIGAAIGGIPLDISAIKDPNNPLGIIDRYKNGKIIVFKKEPDQEQIGIGIFEHESLQQKGQVSNGWLLSDSTPSIQLKTGQWYHILATLSGSNLTTKVWQEGQENQAYTATTPVTPLPSSINNPLNMCSTNLGQLQRLITSIPLSVIYSGASIEFDIINPENTQNYQPSKAYLSTAKPIQTEEQREVAAQQAYKAILNPTELDHFTLSAADPLELIKGHYIYTTSNTILPKQIPNIPLDYVICCSISSSGIAENVGIAPTSPAAAPNALISFINGHLYDQSGNTVFYQPFVWLDYQQANNNINNKLTEKINNSRINYAQIIADKTYQVGNFVLKPTSAQDIAAGQYIYQTSIANLADYVLLAKLEQDTVTMGLPYDPNNPQYINAVVSLTTSQVYPIDTDPKNPQAIRQVNINAFTKAHPLRPDLAAQIKLMQDQRAKQQQIKPITTSPANTPSSSSAQQEKAPEITTPPATMPAASEASLNQQQQEASAGGW